MNSRFVGVAGLPRSGSTLLCQLLSEHPEIYCEGHSSPVINALLATRRMISDEPYFLSQLDVQFEKTYGHLQTAMSGFLNGWYADCGKPVVADKNRAWLHALEFMMQLDPQAKVLVSIRELGQVYGSIEAQHQKTILTDFIDHLADFDRIGRADQLFARDKSIGAPLTSIQAVQDLSQEVKDRLYFVKFEDLLAHPVETMSGVYQWLGVAPRTIDPTRLTVRPHESDSHYRFKYRHTQRDAIAPTTPHAIPARIQDLILNGYRWYYEWFYPEYLSQQPGINA